MAAEEQQRRPSMRDEGSAQAAATRAAAPRSRAQNLVAAALIAAIMAALGPVAVTAGTVPITLQIFPVVLAALLLSPGWAAAAMGVYLVLGAIGIPVYAQGTAGFGVLLGPTGGYIVGFVLGAFLGAFTRTALAGFFRREVADVVASIAAVAAVYLVGWAWLALGPTHLPLVAAFVGGVAPFLLPDLVKAAVAILVAAAVRRATSS